jgi:hypothetical protein
VEGKPYDAIAGNSPVFSPDSKKIAYLANKSRRQFMVVDGKTGPEFAAIPGGPLFHKDDSLEYIGMRYSGIYRVKHKP